MPKTPNKPRRKPLTSLPTPDEGHAGLESVVDAFGEEATFKFIGEVRDHRGDNLVSRFRAALATAMVEVEGGNRTEARRAVADRLRYAPKSRPNFYKVDAAGRESYDARLEQAIVDSRTGRRPRLRRLPTPEDGFEGLMWLVEAYGPEATYMFLAWLRDPNASVVGLFRTQLAVRLVDAEGGHATACRVVADRLGYTGKGEGETQTRTNFNKLVEAGRLGLTGRYDLLNRR